VVVLVLVVYHPAIVFIIFIKLTGVEKFQLEKQSRTKQSRTTQA
jgi:hypothetical protein